MGDHCLLELNCGETCKIVIPLYARIWGVWVPGENVVVLLIVLLQIIWWEPAGQLEGNVLLLLLFFPIVSISSSRRRKRLIKNDNWYNRFITLATTFPCFEPDGHNDNDDENVRWWRRWPGGSDHGLDFYPWVDWGDAFQESPGNLQHSHNKGNDHSQNQ